MRVRDPLLGALATMWDEADPMPDGLIDRVLVALALDDLELEYELLHLVSRSDCLAGTRGPDDVLTLTFDSGELTMVLRVSRTGADTCRIDGWVTNPSPMSVTLTQAGGSVDTAVESGRFALAGVRCTPSRFVVRPHGDGPTLATPSVDL